MFCYNYSIFQNPKEAAIKAGYSSISAEKTAQKLLLRKDIYNKLKKNKSNLKREQILNLSIAALKKLIFSRPNDAVILALNHSNLNEKQLENLDLLQLTEMKKLKDGSFEFKFADRFKAIDCLINILEKFEDENELDNFLEALKNEPNEKYE